MAEVSAPEVGVTKLMSCKYFDVPRVRVAPCGCGDLGLRGEMTLICSYVPEG